MSVQSNPASMKMLRYTESTVTVFSKEFFFASQFASRNGTRILEKCGACEYGRKKP